MQKHVLLVDHSTERRTHIKNLLADRNIQVAEAGSCEEALETLASHPTQLVLTETELPGKSGLHLLKTIKEKTPDTEVILLTNNASSFTLLQALRSGAYDFIVRPIDTGAILDSALERAFNHLQLREQNRNLLKKLEHQNRSLHRTLDMFKSLNTSIEQLAAANSIEELFQILLTTAMAELQAEKGLLALFDRSADRLALKVSKGISAEECRKYSPAIPPGVVTGIARRGKPLLIRGELPPPLAAKAGAGEIGSLLASPGLLAAPLRRKEKVIGMLILSGSRKAGGFDEAGMHFLLQLANHTILALEKVGIIHQLRRGKLVQVS